LNRAPNITEFRRTISYCFDCAAKFPINVTRGRETFVLMTRDYYAKLINRIDGTISAQELKNIDSFVRIRTIKVNSALPTVK